MVRHISKGSAKQWGAYMEDFGLAVVKREGESMTFDGCTVGRKAHKPSKTRWIEMCYDPDEDTSHLPIELITQIIDAEIIKGGLSEDDVYLIIKALANEFVKD